MASTYLIKVYKPGTKVYRTATVPGWTTLDQLHEAIHEWMEFPTYEMYAFFPNNKLLSESGYYAPQMNRRSAQNVRLDSLGLKAGQRFLYVYDMTELMQFYIHIDQIEDRYTEEIHLIRRGGHLNFHAIPEPEELELPDDPDAWRVYEQEISMRDCIASGDVLNLMDTAHCMDISLHAEMTADELADAIYDKLMSDEDTILRMMPLHFMHVLEQIWKSPDGEIVTMPYDFLIRLSLLGFFSLIDEEDNRVIVVCPEAKDWYTELLSKQGNLREVERYSRWNALARGILFSYGVIQMDDFLKIFGQYVNEQPTVQEVCDFMMQRMEWSEEICAIQDDTDLYWSVPDPDRAAFILKKREEMPVRYKAFSRREILDNAESAGWQKVDCGQELFEALQGMAMEPEDIHEVLEDIIKDFTRGMEPSEVMQDCIPPASVIGRSAHAKIRLILREIKRQLPSYIFKGYTQKEMEERHPEYRSVEGITILRGGAGG